LTDGDLGRALARVQNERLAEARDEHPTRFAALGTVPLQHAQSAVEELEYCIADLGMKGVQIAANIDGRDLDDPRFIPFWQRASELGAVVLIHPSGFSDARRFSDWFLTNTLGNPLDSTVALLRLIHSGRLAQFPDLKLVVVHGGGFLPFYWARMDHAWANRPEAAVNIDQPPSSYLKRVHFDTMVFDPDLIANLVTFAGPEQVMLGTDYPFDMGHYDPVGMLARVERLGAEDQEAIRGRNAARLFGLT